MYVPLSAAMKSFWYDLNLGNTHSKRLNVFQAYNAINLFLVFKMFLNNVSLTLAEMAWLLQTRQALTIISYLLVHYYDICRSTSTSDGKNLELHVRERAETGRAAEEYG